jgi:hypothetical protein
MFDLSLPPYREYVEMLRSLRDSNRDWPRVQACSDQTQTREVQNQNELDRARVALLLLLDATPADLALIRFLLDQEIAARRANSFQGASDTLTVLSVLLMELGDASDTSRFWRAKRANFDTWAGGYDIEFVFTWRSASEVLQLLLPDATSDEVAVLQNRITAPDPDAQAVWRSGVAARFPRSLSTFDDDTAELWAELFGDREGQERFGLLNATTATSRGYLYRRLERFGEAVGCWREAAKQATTSWDKVSHLSCAISDAARAGMVSLEDVAEIDRLRADIPSWHQVGLGRSATQACYELAIASAAPEMGRPLWQTAERWRAGLDSLPLVGLEAAREAAARWGDPADVARLDVAIKAERARIAR